MEDPFRCTKMMLSVLGHCVCLNWFLFVCCLTTLPSRSLMVPLEAAFQGRCEEVNPCDQSCFNLHDKMYECDCREGFYLHTNGYNCIKLSLNGSLEPRPPATTEPNIAIQIEVDIDPPAQANDDLSVDQLTRLGLPSHHVHYRAGKQEIQPAGTELLGPQDIQVSYTLKEEEPEEPERTDHRKPLIHKPPTPDPLLPPENMDPPRALPAIAETFPVEPATASLKDYIFSVPAFCGLDCGPGSCHMDRDGPRWLGRCICPAGWTGLQCAAELDISSPEFTGLSYLSLPTLQNAYSDLHLSLEFRPVANTGLLLLTGETEDMTGDYLALVLVDGFIELRLDCGTGPGVVRTSGGVQLDSWNQVSVYRHDWGVWVQLNGGKKEEGRSQGLFSRITFNQPVYMGGPGDMQNVKSFLGTELGFQGCVRNLEINKKKYSFNLRTRGGDTLAGADVGSCSASGCTVSSCGLGACRSEKYIQGGREGSRVGGCDCPLGTTGDNCQIQQQIRIPHFGGNSYLRHVGLGDAALIWLDLEVVFNPSEDQGLILYNGNRRDGRGDFMAVFLNEGFVEFVFDLGNGIATARSSGRASMNTWNTVSVSRTGREVYLTLEGVEGPTAISEGGFSQLSLAETLWVGGVANSSLLSAYLPVIKPYTGCIQKIVLNGLSLDLVDSAMSGQNIENCQHPCSSGAPPCGAGTCLPRLQSFTCLCPPGWQGGNCETRASEPTSTPGFSGNSLLYFDNADINENMVGPATSINIRLRVESSHGLLLWVGSEEGGVSRDEGVSQDYLILGVDRGFVQFWLAVGGGEVVLEYNRTRVDDGLWHRVRATRTTTSVSLMVDSGEVMTSSVPSHIPQIEPKTGLYLGGVEEENAVANMKYRTGLTGCIAELTIGNLVNVNMLHSADRGRNINACSKP